MPVPEGLKHMVVLIGSMGCILGGGLAMLTAKKTFVVAGCLFGLVAVMAVILW